MDEVREMALALMGRYGLQNWIFKFNRGRRRAGICFFPHPTRAGRIELSVHFCQLNTLDEVRETVLHEIAHAMAFLEHGEKGHGPAWKAACVKVGAKPKRLYDGEAIRMPAGKWQATCPKCKARHHLHRKPKRMEGWYCKNCGREEGKIEWEATASPAQ